MPSEKFHIPHSEFRIRERGVVMKWEYKDHMAMFKETQDGLVSNLEFMHAWGADGWELATSLPLIAPKVAPTHTPSPGWGREWMITDLHAHG